MTEASEPTGAQRVLNSRYRIESLIGRGGMADVYLAHDLSLDRQVAVKMLRPDLARDPQFQTRFRREAQSSASLNHHNIVGVYDTGRTDVENSHQDEVKTPYIVMEYVDGVTLRHIMHGTPRLHDTGDVDSDETVVRSPEDAPPPPADSPSDSDVLALGEDSRSASSESGPAAGVGRPLDEKIDEALATPISEQEAAGYMSGILGALSYSHTKGIVHRDIKPSNVMVCSDGDVKVMDFGIARALADSASTMTQSSTVVGTAQYLSPEQARGELVDHRSDLYSAGCVLFELLTNRPPFQGESPVSVAYQHVREQPPTVSELNPQVSPAMESVVAKALTKDPAERFQTAEQFDQALQDALRGIPVDDAPTAAIAAVGARSDFDEVVGGAGAGTLGSSLSARTPEDPDLVEDEPEPRPRRRRRSRAWLWILLVIALLAGGGWALAQMLDDQQVQIPEVEGMERNDALETLSEVSITPEIEDVPHQDIEADYAVGTDPDIGTSIEPGEEAVTLYISSGPDDAVIPDGLQGETQDTVQATLQDLGLEIGDVSENTHPSVESGTLITTNPEAGTTVEQGSEVDLILSNGLVELPSVVGMSEAEATATLQEQGLNVTPYDWESGTAEPGTVLATHIDSEEVVAGSSVAQNATVTISIAVAPQEDEDTGNGSEEDSDEGDSGGDGSDDGDGGDGDGSDSNGGNGGDDGEGSDGDSGDSGDSGDGGNGGDGGGGDGGGDDSGDGGGGDSGDSGDGDGSDGGSEDGSDGDSGDGNGGDGGGSDGEGSDNGSDGGDGSGSNGDGGGNDGGDGDTGGGNGDGEDGG